MKIYVFKNINKITPKLGNGENVLIQAFISAWNDDGSVDIPAVEDIIENLKRRVPGAKIIGASSGEKIIDGKIQKFKNVFVITVFENSIVDTYLIKEPLNISQEIQNASVAMKKKFDKKLIKNFIPTKQFYRKEINSKPIATICFADGIHINGEEVVNSINKFFPETRLSGGLASDEKRFQETFVFTEDGLSNKGIVLANIYSQDIEHTSVKRFNWDGFGKKFIVTKSEGNKVFELDNKPIIDLYENMLGSEMSTIILNVCLEFPLVFKQNKETIGRAVMEINNEKNYLSFAGNIVQGSEVQFGLANLNDIFYKTDEIKNQEIDKMKVIFVYNCISRRALAGIEIQNETLQLQSQAPTYGFFTYGEFYGDGEKNVFLNQSLSAVGFREGMEKSTKSSVYIPLLNKRSFSSKSEINIIKYVSNCLEEEKLENDRLRKKIEELEEIISQK